MVEKNKDLEMRQGSRSLYDFNRLDSMFEDIYYTMNNMWRNGDLRTQAFEALQPKTKFPKINVKENDSEYRVEIAVSGIERDSLSLEFRDSCLFIKSDKVEEKEEEGEKILLREISSRSFRRAVSFVSEIDSSNIKSKYDDEKGLVICTLPKKQEVKPEVIKIDIE